MLILLVTTSTLSLCAPFTRVLAAVISTMTTKAPPETKKDDKKIERWKGKLPFEFGVTVDGFVVDSDVKDIVEYIRPIKELQKHFRRHSNYPLKTRLRFPVYYQGWAMRDELFQELCRRSLQSGGARLVIRDSTKPGSSRATKERVATMSFTCDQGTRYDTKAAKDEEVRCPFAFTVFLASDDYWYLSVSSTTKDCSCHVGHEPLSREQANKYACKINERANADSANKKLADEEAVTQLFQDCWEMAKDNPILRKRMRSGLERMKAEMLSENTRLEQQRDSGSAGADSDMKMPAKKPRL